MPFQIPKPQYSFFNLSCEIVLQVSNVAVSPSALVCLIRSLWHLNESLLASQPNPRIFSRRNASKVINIRQCFFKN